MAAIKTSAALIESTPRYHVVDAHGNHAVMKQASIPQLGISATAVLVIESGGNRVVLTQANATDLATAISNFGSTGALA
jgi:hypothetical protein